MALPLIVLLIVGLTGVPFLLGMLLRLRLQRARPDVLAMLASTTFLFLLEQIPVLPAVRMQATVRIMFEDPFKAFPSWLVAALFCCMVLARIAIPYLLARRGVWLVDRLGLR